MTKLNKIVMDVKVEKKVDNRVNNTGRPVNKKSNRQQRLAKQAFYSNVNGKCVSGNKFKINNFFVATPISDITAIMPNAYLVIMHIGQASSPIMLSIKIANKIIPDAPKQEAISK